MSGTAKGLVVPFVRKLLDMKFKHKLFISYLVVTFIPMLILGVYAYDRSAFNLKEQARVDLYDSVQKTAGYLDLKLQQYENLINFITYNTSILQIVSSNYFDMIRLTEDYRDRLEPVFNNITSLNRDVVKLTIYTSADVPEYGTMILSSNKVADESWYKDAEAVTRWYAQGRALFGVRSMIDLTSSRKLGALYMEIDYNLLFASMFGSDRKQYGLVVQDARGDLIYAQDRFDDAGFRLPAERLQSVGSGAVTIDGTEYLIIRRQLTGADWHMYAYTPIRLITVQATGIIKATAMLLGLCLVIALSTIWFFSNSFVGRIRRLNNRMKRVGMGDFNVEIKSDSQDEIGQLTNSFAFMVAKVNELIEEIYKGKIVQKEAEMKALQAQINPHFLYNTLSLMKWKALEIEADELSRIIGTVSTFYRTSLNRGRNMISIRDELENMKAYIDIQLIMHDNDFRVTYDIDPAVYQYDMINLILQPIVENAINHGIDGKEGGEGQLTVSARLCEDAVEIAVCDNGIGMDKAQLSAIWTDPAKGYGLKNVQERIRLFFGENYGLTVESDAQTGTKVNVRFPKFIKKLQ